MSDKHWVEDRYQGQAPVVERGEMLDIIEAAGLSQALMTQLQRYSQELIDAGADANDIRGMRVQDFKESVFRTLPHKAVEVIVRWLAELSMKDLQEFKEKYKEKREQRLSEYLLPLRMHCHGFTGKPEDLQKRARVFLASMADDEFKGLISAMLEMRFIDEEAKKFDIYRDMRKSVDNPHQCLANGGNRTIDDVAVACAVAIKSRDRDLATSLLAEVKRRDNAEPEDMRFHDQLSKYYQDKMPRQSIKSTALAHTSLDHFSGLEGLEVLAECNKREGDQYAFSRIIAVRDPEEGTWYELDKNGFERMFPNTGSVIHRSGKQYPQLPRHMSYAVWEVEEQSMTSKEAERFSTKVCASRRVCPVHRVLNLEHISSKEHSLARQWLRHTTELDNDAEGERVLRFEDGLFVHTSSSYHRLIVEHFTQGLRSWHDLPMLDVGNGVYLYVGELPEDTAGEYHLTSPVETLIRQIRQMKNCTASEKEVFAKALGLMGENHAISERLSGMDLGGFRPEDPQGLVDLLARSESFVNEIEKQSKSLNKVSMTKVNQAEQELKSEQDRLDQVNQLLAKRHGIVEKFEVMFNDMEKSMRSDIQEEGRKFHERVELYSAAATSELEKRVERLEQQLAGKG